jgi:two-component system phosphate regulon response regulator PhoB
MEVDGKGNKIAVVVVEDDFYVLDFMRFTLEQHGYQVFGAPDGVLGIDLIRRHLPCVVVLDLMLPRKDGFSILKEMGEDAATADIPVVVVSAYTASESTRRLVTSQRNVREVFTKPVRSKDFIQRVKEIAPV